MMILMGPRNKDGQLLVPGASICHAKIGCVRGRRAHYVLSLKKTNQRCCLLPTTNILTTTNPIMYADTKYFNLYITLADKSV